MYELIAQNKYGEQLKMTNNPRYVITDVDGLYPPEGTINTTQVANTDGSVFNSSRINDRVITITMAINAPAEANRILLYRYFKTKYPVRLYYKNGTRDVYIDGYVSKFSVEYFEKKQTAQIEITCPMALFRATKGKQYGIFEYRKYVYFSVCNRRGRGTVFLHCVGRTENYYKWRRRGNWRGYTPKCIRYGQES